MTIKKISLVLLVGIYLLTGCTMSKSANPTPPQSDSATSGLFSTETPLPLLLPTLTPVFTPTATPIPPVAPAVCTDPAVMSLIDSLKTSMLTADGELLGSLVSPNGMEVRYFRNGNVVTYTPYQASFLFETTFEANWGNDPASGLEKIGSFHDVIVPDLVSIFNQSYTIQCNEIRHGGATYEVTWPYSKDFYSFYYPGTEVNGNLDWHTWVIGVEYNNNEPSIYALMQYYWEP